MQAGQPHPLKTFDLCTLTKRGCGLGQGAQAIFNSLFASQNHELSVAGMTEWR